MSTYYDRYWKVTYPVTKLGDFHYKLPVIQKLFPTNQKITILDYGCGKGIFTNILQQMNPQSKIVGVDISEFAISKAKKKYVDISFSTVTDGGKIPMKSSSVDFILTADVIEHVYNTETLVNEFKRVLKPGGEILITTPYHGLIKNLIIVLTAFDMIFNPSGPHIRFFTKKSLTQMLENVHLEVKKVGYFGRFFPIPRGMYMLAQKKPHG